MRILARVIALSGLLSATLAHYLLAAESQVHWSTSVALGAVDQEAIGGTPTVAVDLARSFTPRLSLGLRTGFFGKDDRSGSSRDTYYGVLFARARVLQSGRTPFAEAGGGRYSFERESLAGWFAGLGFSLPLSGDRAVEAAARYHSVERPDFGPLPDFKELHVALRFGF
jgi:hypothetical protein